ncbi:hypothetical protein [Ochrobactrum sp. POC9]|nr:hypothetical protein [Ochrobactrum sp. POC9]
MTPQERLVQAINDATALSLIIGDLFDKDDEAGLSCPPAGFGH